MGFFDRFRTHASDATDPAKDVNISTGEVGYSHSDLYASKDFPRYNPDTLLQRKGYGIYKRMMQDDQVKAVVRFKQHAVLSRGYHWDIEVNEEGVEDPKQREIADFFDAVLCNIAGSWSDKLQEILSAIYNGFSICEKVYAPFMYDNKTYWGVQDIKLRPAGSMVNGIATDKHGNITGIIQHMDGKNITIPLNKVIHFVHQPDIDRHYGESDLRAAYRAYWSKDVAIKFQNIYLERAATGFPYAKVEGTLQPAQRADLESALQNLSTNTSMILPHNVDLNQFQPIKTDAYEAAIAMYDKAISKSILVPNLLGLSEQGQTGSYSQSQTQLDAFFWIVETIGNRLAECLNEQLFKPLSIINFGTECFPKYTMEEISETKKKEISDAWGNLVQKGAVTKSDTDERYIRNLLGFPEKAEEEEDEEEPNITPEPGSDDEGDEDAPNPDDPDEQDQLDPPDNEKANMSWAGDDETKLKLFADQPWLKRTNFARIQRAWDKADDGMVEDMSDIAGKMRISLEDQIAKMSGGKSFGNVDPKLIDTLKIPASLLTSMRKTVRNGLSNVLDESYAEAAREIPQKKFAARKPIMDKIRADKYLSSKSMSITGIYEQDVLKNVKNTISNGMKYDKSLTEIMKDLDTSSNITELLPMTDSAGRAVNKPARIENIVRTNTAESVNMARDAYFKDPDLKGFVQAFQYSAILDDRTSGICAELDGRIRKDWGSYTPPNHYQCRSLLIPVLSIDKWDGKQDNIPSSAVPTPGFA